MSTTACSSSLPGLDGSMSPRLIAQEVICLIGRITCPSDHVNRLRTTSLLSHNAVDDIVSASGIDMYGSRVGLERTTPVVDRRRISGAHKWHFWGP